MEHEEMTLKEYIAEKKQVLKDFGVYKFCTTRERAELKNAISEMNADRITRTLIDRHFDESSTEFDVPIEDIGINVLTEIGNCCLPIRIKNALMSSKIFTFKDFIKYVNENGWNTIKNFGPTTAKIVFTYMNPAMSEKEIDNLVKISKSK